MHVCGCVCVKATQLHSGKELEFGNTILLEENIFDIHVKTYMLDCNHTQNRILENTDVVYDQGNLRCV